MAANSFKYKIRIAIILLCFTGWLCACSRQEKETLAEPEEELEKVIEEVAEVEIPKRDYELYVAVPIESMSMRKTPGYGEDVVAQIYPQTLLRTIGEPKEASGKTFYHLKTMDGAYEGYCAADYCIKISYEYDDEALNIVDTSNAVYSYEDMTKDLNEIVERYPDHVAVDIIGESVEGRAIYRAVLGNPDASKKIFIQAGIHGREYMSCQQVMKMLEYYAAYYEIGYYEDTLYSDLFENIVLHIVPMSNPDGVSISQRGEEAVSSKERISMMRNAYERDKETLIHAEDAEGNFYWYDTYANPDYDRYAAGYDEIISYEEYLTLWKANANGVDINRNFGAGWEDIQQKEEPGCEFFKGYSSDSEPETVALEKQITENEYICILNYHAKGQLIYYDVAGNTEEVARRSKELADIVGDLNRHQLINCQDTVNIVLGGLGDWAMLVENTPSITIEVGKKPCPLGSEEFVPIWNRGREVWVKVMKEM